MEPFVAHRARTGSSGALTPGPVRWPRVFQDRVRVKDFAFCYFRLLLRGTGVYAGCPLTLSRQFGWSSTAGLTMCGGSCPESADTTWLAARRCKSAMACSE